MAAYTSFFSNPEDFEKISGLTILDAIAAGLEQIPNTKHFEIIGCYALNKQLKDNYARLTYDIDLSIFVKDTWEYIVNNLVSILNSMQDRYKFKIIKRRGYEKNPNSDSITFSVTDLSSNIIRNDIKIDMNIKTPNPHRQLKIGSLYYSDIYTMFSNKLYVAGTQKIYRRVKDFYDIHSILKCEVGNNLISASLLFETFNKMYSISEHNRLECFDINYYDKLKQAYTKNTLFKNLELFDEIFPETVKFIQMFYMEILKRCL